VKPRLLAGRPRHSRRPLLTGPDLDDGGRRFLGRFDEEGLRSELERHGILPALRARGYGQVVLQMSCEHGEHRLRIRARGLRPGLVDLRLTETAFVVDDPVALRGGVEVLSVLFNTWLSLQDPRASFTAEKPRLPGQKWPGLGLSRAFYALMSRWAQEWGKDAVLATPEYFHNAVFYSPAFSFLSPVEQGRFEALRRDLVGLSVAAASAVVQTGRVLDLVAHRRYEWRPGPMAAPHGEALRRFFGGEEYRQAVRAAREGARFRPLRSDWS
jgi:hypothetical protein